MADSLRAVFCPFVIAIIQKDEMVADFAEKIGRTGNILNFDSYIVSYLIE
jgi:hypothetical protein